MFTAEGAPTPKVVERVLHHYRTRPHLSLGVITFSESQAAGIETAVRAARSADAELDQLVLRGRLNGFFVKPVEFAQGDERDVIILVLEDADRESVDSSVSMWPSPGPVTATRSSAASTLLMRTAISSVT